jgi:dipeptidyl aminopeptidase/acylaminoacyl peptidase
MLPEPQLAPDAPWKERFRAPAVLWTQIAKNDPTTGLVAANFSGVNQLYAWNVTTGELRQLSHRPEGLSSGLLSPNGRYIYYLEDEGGNEVGHYVRLPLEGSPAEDLTPDLPPYSTFGIAAARAGNLIAFLLTDSEGFHLYAIEERQEDKSQIPNPKIAQTRPLAHFSGLTWGPVLSADGAVAVLDSTERTGKPQYSLVAVDMGSGERIGELWDGPDTSVKSALFASVTGDYRLLATTNRTGTETLLIWNPRTGERTDLELVGLRGSPQVYDWSADGRLILLGATDQAVQQLFVYDLENNQLTPLVHPAGTYFGLSFGPDNTIYAHWQDATRPNCVLRIAYSVLPKDAENAQRNTEYTTILAAADVPPGRPWQSVSFPSSDGQAIQAWLALPEGAGPFPAVIDLIGGPHDVATNRFSAAAQMWLDHGFAFLAINYRGNVTFGRAFKEKIWGNPGYWEVEDIAAAHDYLISAGIVPAAKSQIPNPKSQSLVSSLQSPNPLIPAPIFLVGWSYGGYLALLAAGKKPGLWAGVIAGLAITDWLMAYEDSADMIKGYLAALFGGTPQEKPDAYTAASPLTYIEQVSAPILIIQGRHDSRTPARPVQLYADRLRELGKGVELHWFDAGHGGAGAQVEQAIAHHQKMLEFAYRVLAGDERAEDWRIES